MPEGTSKSGRSVRPFPVSVTPSLGDWHRRGLCVGEDPGIFFPASGDSGTMARGICIACLVGEDCLEYATKADEFGIWGSLDQQQRRARRRRQRRQTARARLSESGLIKEGA
jgi:WhiB family transcriptional regulator, redox-sensing transcriptional regulator